MGVEGLGRPAYLGDELYNKALFGEVYPGDDYLEEGGPRTVNPRTRVNRDDEYRFGDVSETHSRAAKPALIAARNAAVADLNTKVAAALDLVQTSMQHILKKSTYAINRPSWLNLNNARNYLMETRQSALAHLGAVPNADVLKASQEMIDHNTAIQNLMGDLTTHRDDYIAAANASDYAEMVAKATAIQASVSGIMGHVDDFATAAADFRAAIDAQTAGGAPFDWAAADWDADLGVLGNAAGNAAVVTTDVGASATALNAAVDPSVKAAIATTKAKYPQGKYYADPFPAHGDDLHYMKDGKVEKVDVKGYKDMLQAIGKMRFDTKFSRNLLWISNIQRILRLKLRRDLNWFDSRIVSEHAVLAPVITEQFGNSSGPLDTKKWMN
jgi:hypothetical protein